MMPVFILLQLHRFHTTRFCSYDQILKAFLLQLFLNTATRILKIPFLFYHTCGK